MTAECPECAATIQLDKPGKGEIVECPECGSELEVVNTEPLELALDLLDHMRGSRGDDRDARHMGRVLCF